MGAEAIQLLVWDDAGRYLDGTCGTGGHTLLILKRITKAGKVIACDLDPRMIEISRRRLKQVAGNFELIQSGYHELEGKLSPDNLPLSGYLLDLGLSSPQLDSQPGFSLRHDTRLDMRFNQQSFLTAEAIINEYSPRELKKIFKEYGELKQSRAIVDTIVSEREKHRIETTAQLSGLISYLFPKDRLFKNLARVGQALRIAVNDELTNIKNGLESLTRMLTSGGRLVVISYHSLEDRIIKNFIRSNSRETGYPPDVEDLLDRREFRLKPLTRKALTPTSQEVEKNPRARSAKLRAAVKV